MTDAQLPPQFGETKNSNMSITVNIVMINIIDMHLVCRQADKMRFSQEVI